MKENLLGCHCRGHVPVSTGNPGLNKDVLNKEVILRGCYSGSQPYERQSGRDSEYRPFSMTLLNRGFTLIELLVVVLIIGILAAVAVPQYQTAVEKSRLAAALTSGRAVMNAQERFWMANGSYAAALENLDVDVSCPKGFRCDASMMNNGRDASNNYKYEMYRLGSFNGDLQLIFNFNQRKLHDFAGRIYCWAAAADKKAKQVCLSLGRNQSTDTYDGAIRVFVE